MKLDLILLRNFILVLLGTILMALFNIYFYDRYNELKIDAGNISRSLLVIDFSIFIAVGAIVKFKSILNPITIYSVFIFFLGYSYIPISNNQNIRYYWLTEVIFFLSIASFLLGCSLHYKRIELKILKLPSSLLKYFFLSTIVAGVFVFSLEVMKIGYMPVLNLGNGLDVYSETNESLIPFGHYLVLFMSLTPAIGFTFWKLERINLLMFIFVLVTGFFIIINFLSRQTIMLLFISLFFAYTYFNKISNLKILLMGFFVISMFVFVGNLRADSSDLEIVNDGLKSYANIDRDVTLGETYISLYSSQNFTTFDKLVMKTVFNERFTFGLYTFKPLISLFFLDRLNVVNYDVQYDGFMNLGTYMIEPFSDFYIIGVILFNTLIGFLAMNTYKSFYYKLNTSSIVNYSLIVYCMIMSPFTNFYLNFFIWFSLILSTLLTNNKFTKTI